MLVSEDGEETCQTVECSGGPGNDDFKDQTVEIKNLIVESFNGKLSLNSTMQTTMKIVRFLINNNIQTYISMW